MGPAPALDKGALRALADAALEITQAESVDDLLRIVTEAAQTIIGTHQAVTTRLRDGWADASTYVALSDKYAAYQHYDEVPRGLGVLNYVTRENTPLRLRSEELAEHPEWRGLRDAPDHPPIPDYLAAPLIGHDGANLGLIQLADKVDGTEFAADDEAMLVQLAQLASAAIQNIERLEHERRARARAEVESLRRSALAEATAAFAAARDRASVLEALESVAVPHLADALVVHVVEGDRAVVARVAHRDAAQAELVRELVERFPTRLDSPHGVGAAIRTGEALVYPEVTTRLLEEIAQSPEHLERLRHVQLGAGIVVPLTTRGVASGAVTLIRSAAQPFADDEIAYVMDIAQRAALALESQRRYELERALAADLERTVGHLGLALEAGRMGTWDWDLASGEVQWSATLEQIYGLEPGSFGGTFESFVERIHPDDRDQAVARIQRARDARSRFAYRHRVVTPAGRIRWVEGAGQCVQEQGELVGMTGVCLDVTDQVHAEQRLRQEHHIVETLHRIGQAISGRLALDDIVEVVTDAATSVTGAQFGAFFYNTVGDDGESYLLYSLAGAAREAFERFPMPRNTAIFDPTFSGSGPVRLADVTADPRFGQNPPYHGMPDGHLPVRSYLAVPVVAASGEVLGGLFFGHPEPGVFTEEAERLAVGIAAQAAVAFERARLFEAAQRELEAKEQAFRERDHVAEVLQHSLLPPSLPEIPGLDVAARYRPGSADVGGDFYDLFALRGRDWAVVIGDVCGKGPEAAALTALARHSARTGAMIHRSPARVLRLVNDAILQDGGTRFCTAALARLRVDAGRGTARVTVALGGHPLPAVVRRDGMVEPAGSPGTVLGVVNDVTVTDSSFELGSGDRLVLVTDGVIEARRGDALFGEERLLGLLAECGAEPASATAKRIEDAVQDFRDHPVVDDLAILVVLVTDLR